MGSKGHVHELWLVDFDPFICEHKNIQRQDSRISIRKVYCSSENWWLMASIYRRLCTITSCIKGDHCYRSNLRINKVCNCISEPFNAYSHNAIVVRMKNTNGGEQDATTVGHVTDSLAEVLYKPLLEKEIKMTCRVSGQSGSAPEGVWVQGGGIEIPCVYEIGVKKGLGSLRKELRDKLIQLVPTTDNTI